MKKLRLLFTKDCNRACPGCCNKDWDLDGLETCIDFTDYSEILITGGEPTLYPIKLEVLLTNIKESTNTPIFIYTARPTADLLFMLVKDVLDGITLTLHKQEDVEMLYLFDLLYKMFNLNKSLRLNVFKGIKVNSLSSNWVIKDNMEWIKDCPLPENEVFMKI